MNRHSDVNNCTWGKFSQWRFLSGCLSCNVSYDIFDYLGCYSLPAGSDTLSHSSRSVCRAHTTLCSLISGAWGFRWWRWPLVASPSHHLMLRSWSKFLASPWRVTPHPMRPPLNPGPLDGPAAVSVLVHYLWIIPLLQPYFGRWYALLECYKYKSLALSSCFVAYGPDSRPPMAIFELLDYIVNEVYTQHSELDN